MTTTWRRPLCETTLNVSHPAHLQTTYDIKMKELIIYASNQPILSRTESAEVDS